MHMISVSVFMHRRDPSPRLVDEIARTVNSLDAPIFYGRYRYRLCGTKNTGYRIYLRGE
jgi:hypothetical protein